MAYDPPRRTAHDVPQNPLEIDLVFNVRPCGSCHFFWPENTSEQPYGPYSSYDFDSNTPVEKEPEGRNSSFVWITGTTRPPSFPDAEVMDGCRKAPIMTIGINPNLTAFGPGATGASWCYPSFSNANGANSWTKYAYYYRYRSVYQEHFDLEFVKQFLSADGQIKALKAGIMIASARLSDDPSYEIRVQYDGDPSPTSIHLPGKLGNPQYVVLQNTNGRFAEGDLLAAKLSIPPSHKADVYGQPISYYTQIQPVLEQFEAFLKEKGYADANLRVGEDVGQLDMVACASPHWGPQWLGGTNQSANTIISNCVHKNAWAIKQLVQTRPAILILVGQASWNMFRDSFSHLVRAPHPIPTLPKDGPYTLLELTTKQDYRLVFSIEISGVKYELSTRLLITPHFSYNENFLPQFRMAPEKFDAFAEQFPTAAEFLRQDARIQIQRPAGGYVAVGIKDGAPAVLAEIARRFADASEVLKACFYDPHRMMSEVLGELFDSGELSYTRGTATKKGVLTRSKGPCSFCDNEHWRFPKGCPYGKPEEAQYDIGFLEKVAQAIVAKSASS
jgi:hypothetical protein